MSPAQDDVSKILAGQIVSGERQSPGHIEIVDSRLKNR